MAVFYPRSRTFLILIICFLAVGGTFFYVRGQNGSLSQASKQRNVPPVVTTAQPTQNPLASSDWKSDFLAVSTSTTPKASATKASTASREPETLTAQTGKDFFEKYALLRQGGLVDDEESVETVVNSIIQNAAEAGLQSKIYRTTDIHISSTADMQSLHLYGNAVAAAFITFKPSADAPEIMTTALEREDEQLLLEIDRITASYKSVQTTLAGLSVPQPVARYHLDLLNALSSLTSATDAMSDALKDPVRAFVAIGSYSGIQDSLRNSLLNIRNLFGQQGVVFGSTEPGILFATII